MWQLRFVRDKPILAGKGRDHAQSLWQAGPSWRRSGPPGERPATAPDVALSDDSPDTNQVPDTFEFCRKPRLISAEVP
jgi:hypothetical protein